MILINDSHFNIHTISKTPNPQQVCWLAAHQDYSENPVYNINPPSENKAGEYIIKHCLKYGHFGIIEHPQIVVNAVGFGHTVIQQLRTHRVGVSFDVQSGRYTGKRILDLVAGLRDIEDVYYFRPAGRYKDRNGADYEYTEDMREEDKMTALMLSGIYAEKIQDGWAEEHAREMIPYAIRQHFVLSGNARSLMHIVSIRGTKDVQPEAYTFASMLLDRLLEWMPEVFTWYQNTRYGKNLLAP